MGLPTGQNLVKPSGVQTLRKECLRSHWIDLLHFKVCATCSCATSRWFAHSPQMGLPMGQKLCGTHLFETAGCFTPFKVLWSESTKVDNTWFRLFSVPAMLLEKKWPLSVHRLSWLQKNVGRRSRVTNTLFRSTDTKSLNEIWKTWKHINRENANHFG